MTIRERLENLRAGTYENRVARLDSGWVIAADTQPVRGYCILIADPFVTSLNELSESARIRYSLDTIAIGDALLKVTGCYRINYETWGNLDPSLHTHVVPRYSEEKEEQRVLPVCRAYDIGAARRFDPKREDRELLARLREELGHRT